MSEVNDKLFYINLSDLEDRLDPLFYVAINKIQKEIVERAKYECIDLIRACSINRGRFGHRPRNDPKFYGGEYPFIQTGDIVKASINNDSIQYTQTLNELGLRTSKLFQPPKLLFTIAANIGDTAILDYPSCFPDSIVALIPHNDNLLLEYLNIYLKYIKPYIEDLAPYSAQKNLNNQQLAQIPLIIPPINIQKKIVSKMDKVYRKKQQKEAEAKALLESIDDYLLQELGIELPVYDNDLDSRMFIMKSTEISHKRIDPFYYKFCINLMNSLKFKEFTVNDLAFIQKGQSITSKDIKVGVYPVIAGGQTSPYSHSIFNYEGNIITISASGAYAGYVWYHNYPIFASDCSVVQTRDENIIFTKFLFEVLKLKQNELYNLQQGSGQPHVYPSDIKNIKIPLPPIEKQSEIIQHIQDIRDKAKQLQEEAKEVLESAKREVEEMILEEE